MPGFIVEVNPASSMIIVLLLREKSPTEAVFSIPFNESIRILSYRDFFHQRCCEAHAFRSAGRRHSPGNMTYFIKAEDTPSLKRGLAEMWRENNEERSMLACSSTRERFCAQAGWLPERGQRNPETAPNSAQVRRYQPKRTAYRHGSVRQFVQSICSGNSQGITSWKSDCLQCAPRRWVNQIGVRLHRNCVTTLAGSRLLRQSCAT